MDEQVYDNLPAHVQQVFDTWDENKDTYAECRRIKQELELIGWSCDYDLSGFIFNIKTI